MRLAVTFFWIHVAALGLAIFGLLAAVPNVSQFASNPFALNFYTFAIANTGSIDILTGALAMIAFGWVTIGWRKTLLFFAIATVVSATAELTGTKTGWPFGGYQYTGFLGFKLGGRVPYTVPLSWFYMGFASYLLATRIIASRGAKNATVWSIVLGAWLLMAWDLVLDPAMASDRIQTQFWIWQEHGAYFGMPLRNLAGWLGTGLLFTALARLAWRKDADLRDASMLLPFGVYAVNVIWAMALSLSVGLWPTALAAIVFSLAPAALAIAGPRRRALLT